MAVQPIVPSYPSTEVIDVLGKWLMLSRTRKGPAKAFLDLPLELIEAHIIDRVLETERLATF